ncbi:DUF4232 domain-containing protein [Streptomyces sp. P6-2-1]|uniref:DUF4232 domain-containing protein n=1 Tax=unclassified Streptomyces TaxID=2593676 RepID=UPI003D365231
MDRPMPLRPAAARALPFVAALAASALLLTACGTEGTTRPGTAQSSAKADSRTAIDDPGKDGVRVTSLTRPLSSPSPAPARSYSATAEGLDLGSAPGISAAYEITNDGPEALTYMVTIMFTDSAGRAMSSQSTTVKNVGPGTTVRGRVGADAAPSGAPPITGAKVTEVAAIPVAEAPGTCAPGGIRVNADKGDAAMGLRVVGLHLTNCGSRDYEVRGYPVLELLDDSLAPVEGVSVLHGSHGITTGIGVDETPRPLTLKPGESATARLVWRNTTDLATPVTVPYVRVRARTGAAPVTVPQHLDLGTTGKLGVTPWARPTP